MQKHYRNIHRIARMLVVVSMATDDFAELGEDVS